MPNYACMPYIGPGVKIIGKVVIGNNVAIGANAVAVGISAKIISFDGSGPYINKIDHS